VGEYCGGERGVAQGAGGAGLGLGGGELRVGEHLTCNSQHFSLKSPIVRFQESISLGFRKGRSGIVPM